MSKESKIFSASLWSAQDTVTHYESFGWELLSINGSQIVMSRESQNPVYSDLVKYQAIYEGLEAEYKSVQAPVRPMPLKPVNIKGAIIGFLCFIVPGALYVAYRVNKKKEYDAVMEDYRNKYAAYEAKRADILNKMQETATKSRAIFFSKQD